MSTARVSKGGTWQKLALAAGVGAVVGCLLQYAFLQNTTTSTTQQTTTTTTTVEEKGRPDPTDAEIEALLLGAGLYGGSGHEEDEADYRVTGIVSVTDCSRGCDQWVKIVRYNTAGGGQGSVVIKLPKREPAKVCEEALCVRNARQLELPVPHILHVDVKEGILVQTLVHGDTLESLSKPHRAQWATETVLEDTHWNRSMKAAYIELGTHLHTLHTQRRGAYGEFREHAADMAESTCTIFTDCLDFKLRNKWHSPDNTLTMQFVHLQSKQLISTVECDALQQWLTQHITVLKAIRYPVLCHGDYDDENVIVSIPKPGQRKWIVKGIIDWGDACWGAAAEDLACMFIKHYGTWAWQVFFRAGYLKRHDYLDVESHTLLVSLAEEEDFLTQVKVFALLRLLWTSHRTKPRTIALLKHLAQEFILEAQISAITAAVNNSNTDDDDDEIAIESKTYW